MYLRHFIALTAFLLLASGAFASDEDYDRPNWGYTFIDAHYTPWNCPEELATFHDQLVPMMEARGHVESAYIREYADALYRASKDVGGSLSHDNADIRKHYNRAARELVRHCARLREIVYGAPSAHLYSEMEAIENTYIRLAALADE